MAFSTLSSRLQETIKRLKGKGKLGEKDVDEALREVRLALLEADVHYRVVKDFIARVKERAVGHEVMTSLSPAQQVIKIVNDELTELMGGEQVGIAIADKPPTVIMLVGLQGSGKTTTAGKLANLLRSQGHHPLLVAADVYRPAAIRQLEVLGEQSELPVFSLGEINPVDIALGAVSHAEEHGSDVIILDTAGRLHIDDDLMEELEGMKAAVSPDEILLVVDAMTGQDAVNVAAAFQERVGIDGIILTKLDGDARGGAALSVKSVTGKPIKFAGISEKLDGLEAFHPDRMASRILGMGDVLSLIEKAGTTIDEDAAKKFAGKLKNAELTLEDFQEQLAQVKKMGPLDQLLGMLPGMGNNKALKNLSVDDSYLQKLEAIIGSMTKEERQQPEIINGSRRRRIARGSGNKVQDVNRLLKQFADTKKMLRKNKQLFSMFR